MIGILSLALAGSCSWAQSALPEERAGLPAALCFDGDPAFPPDGPDRARESFLSIEGWVEMAQDRERIVDSHNNLGLPPGDLKQGLHFTDTHELALLRAGLVFPFGSAIELRLHGAGGVDRTGSHVTSGTENPVFGSPLGTTETDFDFGLAPAWDAGAEFRLAFGDGPVDVAASFDARGGGDTEQDAATRESYHYERFRGGLFAGWTFYGSIRPYAGVHLSYYRARFQLTDQASGSDVLFRVGYQDPLSGAVGVNVSSGRIVGTVEVDFVGTFTVLASAGIRF